MNDFRPPPQPSEAMVLAHLKTIARTELEMHPDQIERISFDTPIVDGLQLDSLRQVVLLANLEETYGFELSLQDRAHLAELETVGDLVRFIQRSSPAL